MIPKAKDAFYYWRATPIRVALSTEEEQEIRTFVTKFFDDIKADRLEEAFQVHRDSQYSLTPAMFNSFKQEWISYKRNNGNIQSIRLGSYQADKRRFAEVHSVMIMVEFRNAKKNGVGDLKLSRIDNEWKISNITFLPWS